MCAEPDSGVKFVTLFNLHLWKNPSLYGIVHKFYGCKRLVIFRIHTHENNVILWPCVRQITWRSPQLQRHNIHRMQLQVPGDLVS
jgi:hypothetical protein